MRNCDDELGVIMIQSGWDKVGCYSEMKMVKHGNEPAVDHKISGPADYNKKKNIFRNTTMTKGVRKRIHEMISSKFK